MGLEDALALTTSDRKLQDALGYADERVRKHGINEGRRLKFGLKTDMERWMKTGEAWD